MVNTFFRRQALWAFLATTAACTAALGTAAAASVTFSGNLGDAANPALVASNMAPALFADEFDTANNVALHALTVPIGGSVSFTSSGYAGGGIDPYFTLFSGVNPATATVLESNYFQATSGDFTITTALAAGDYTVALSVFQNLSFAENLGTGFLADGFTALGGPIYFGNGSYVLTVTLPDRATPVPEPGAGWLVLTAAGAALYASRRGKKPTFTGERP